MIIPIEVRQHLLRKLVVIWGDYLQPRIPFANARLILAALAEVESTFGSNCRPKYEPAYDVGGGYWTPDNAKKWSWYTYGPIVCCSYSSWQMMYPTALELGLCPTLNPTCLNHDEIAVNYVCEYLIKRVLDKGAGSLEELADAYNSGSFRDKNVPENYVKKFIAAYKNVQMTRGIDIS